MVWHKFIYQRANGNTTVHMEMWVDKSNGANGGTWKKVISTNDNKTVPWSGKAQCNANEGTNYIILEAVRDIFTRNTGITEADYKYFSVREINHLP